MEEKLNRCSDRLLELSARENSIENGTDGIKVEFKTVWFTYEKK